MSFCLVSEKNIFLAIDPNDYSSPETENKNKKNSTLIQKRLLFPLIGLFMERQTKDTSNDKERQMTQRIETNRALFRSRHVFVLSILKLRSYGRYEYLVKVCVPSQIYMMCLLQCLVICKSHYIILWPLLRFVCSMKANASYIVRALIKVCIFL